MFPTLLEPCDHSVIAAFTTIAVDMVGTSMGRHAVSAPVFPQRYVKMMAPESRLVGNPVVCPLLHWFLGIHYMVFRDRNLRRYPYTRCRA